MQYNIFTSVHAMDLSPSGVIRRVHTGSSASNPHTSALMVLNDTIINMLYILTKSFYAAFAGVGMFTQHFYYTTTASNKYVYTGTYYTQTVYME